MKVGLWLFCCAFTIDGASAVYMRRYEGATYNGSVVYRKIFLEEIALFQPHTIVAVGTEVYNFLNNKENWDLLLEKYTDKVDEPKLTWVYYPPPLCPFSKPMLYLRKKTKGAFYV